MRTRSAPWAITAPGRWSVASSPPPQSPAPPHLPRSGRCKPAQSIFARCPSSPANRDRRSCIGGEGVLRYFLTDGGGFFSYFSFSSSAGGDRPAICLLKVATYALVERREARPSFRITLYPSTSV